MPELRRSSRVASKPTASLAEVDSDEFTEEVEPAPKRAKKETPPKAAAVATKELEVGDDIPDITLFDQDENEVSLKSIASEKKYVVIFAYPKASTPGCTRQVCGFQRNYEFLSKADVAVFGLSADLPKAQKTFVTKQKLEYQLLSDPSKELIGVLGAKKSPTGIKRSHWIFVDGVLQVKKIQISPEASIDGAKEDIERFIKESKDVKKDEPKVEDEDKENKEVEPKEENGASS